MLVEPKEAYSHHKVRQMFAQTRYSVNLDIF